MKTNRIIELVIAATFVFFFAVLFCPIYENQLGYEVFFTNYRLSIAYFAPMIACVLPFFKKKIHSIELVSMILLLTSAVILIKEVDESLSRSAFVFIDIGLLFLDILLFLYVLNSENEYSVRDIVESAMLVALAVGLDLPGFKLRIGANGGSISFTMLPLFVLALRLGTLKGFIASAIVYGSITCLLDADGGGLNTYIFDYFFGYGSIAIIGFFRNFILKKDGKYSVTGFVFLIVGTVLAISGRLVASTISGMVFWETPFVESLIYNALYILPSGGFCLAALLLLYKPIMIVNNRFPNKSSI